MTLQFSTDEKSFRKEIRSYLDANTSAEIRLKGRQGLPFEKQDTVEVYGRLNAAGLAVPHWAPEWGGAGWSPARCYILREEIHRAGLPEPHSINSSMIGPVLIEFGTEKQKKQHLPVVASHAEWWCQGFSEPGAGSDLASLRTRAERSGDHYLINGQKIWTSQAHIADWMFCLVRTNTTARKQDGISFLLIDMRTPGITIRPIVSIDRRHHLNEVFFENVRVPGDNLVGEENRGWEYAKFLLGNERANIARVGLTKSRVLRVKEVASRTPSKGATLADDPRFQDKLTLLEVELRALELTQLRVLSKQDAPDIELVSSVLKLKGSELYQGIQELLLQTAGLYALPVEAAPTNPIEAMESVFPAFAYSRAFSIFGGTSEIQRSIIARMLLR